MKKPDLHNPPNTYPDGEGFVRIPNWIIFLLFLIPILVYLPGILGKIPYPSESASFTDLILTHYPYALYLKQSLLEYHQIPFWSNIIHSGAPFAANPLAGLFYLPGWLAIIFPLPEGISVALAMHSVFGSWGMYLFLKRENSNNIGAVAGALCFGLMPKIAAHYGAGHVTLIYAINWTPWLFYASKKDQVGWKTGIAAAMLFLADPRWAVYAGLFWFTYDIAHRHYSKWKDYLWFYLRSGLNAVFIASPLILPLIEFTRLSTRTNLDLADIQLYAFPPQKLLGVLIPASGGNPEWYVYAGGIILGLGIFQVWNIKTIKNTRFWIIWIIISFLLSFGSWIIEPTWLVNIPILSLLRVPARILFLIGFCFSAITAITLQGFVDKKNSVKISRLVGYGLIVFSILMMIGILGTVETTPLLAIWGFLFLLLAGSWLLLCSTNLNRNGLAWIFVSLVVVDLLGAGLQGVTFKNKIEPYDEETVNFLINDPGIFRIYSPSYSIPQHLAAEYSLEMADGVDPLQI
ncbi:MAG: hypothetical protein MUP11_08745, partial [Anaerolineales bacterium]|nr:hypothetical protein [Anaerolineales bacterium]